MYVEEALDYVWDPMKLSLLIRFPVLRLEQSTIIVASIIKIYQESGIKYGGRI